MVTVAAERLQTRGHTTSVDETVEISVTRGFPDGIVFFSALVGARTFTLAIQPEDWADILKETERDNGTDS